jgi:glycosyltransferase involved in cell wall biosynthesis
MEALIRKLGLQQSVYQISIHLEQIKMAAKKNIGIFHYQVGGTDGVSLEIEKWKSILENMGHTVHLIGGDLGTAKGILIKEMYHHLPESKRLNRNTFQSLSDFDPEGYQAELDRMTTELVEKFRMVIQDNQIDLILAENVWCVAANPAVAPALEIVRQELNLPAVAHNHDFYWERREGFSLTCSGAAELADKYLPPHDRNIKHTVINSLAQQALLDRKGISSTIIPNVFDFESPAWTSDDYNQDLRAEVGLGENDLVLLQATRIVARKGIELAIDFVRTLQKPNRRKFLEENGLYDGRSFSPDSRIVLVLAGYARDDATGTYKDKLIQKAKRAGVDLVFIEDRVDADRDQQDGKKIYSLWDTYPAADLVTYPSLWEGWGNQFLEAVKAKLPLLIFEYPVYKSDIEKNGFKTISLGDTIRDYDDNQLARVEESILETAADQAIELLTNQELRAEHVDHNYQVAQNHYSLDSLARYLEPLFLD